MGLEPPSALRRLRVGLIRLSFWGPVQRFQHRHPPCGGLGRACSAFLFGVLSSGFSTAIRLAAA